MNEPDLKYQRGDGKVGCQSLKRILLVGIFSSSSLVNPGICEDLAFRLSSAGWGVCRISNKKGRLPRMLDIVTTAVQRRNEYMVAHVDVYSGWAFLWAEITCVILRLLHKPYVLSLHGGNLPAFSCRWPNRVYRLFHSAAIVTAPSPYLVERLYRFREDICVLPNPIKLSSYTFALRYPPRPRLIWIRAFHAIYNPSLLVQVISILKKDFAQIALTMIGPDKGDGSLKAVGNLAHRLKVHEQMIIPGAVPKDDIPQWLNRHDIFLNTTTIDNTPVSVLEAMASGLCVVSTNVGGISYLLEHEKDGLLVPSNDPGAMAHAVRRILLEPGLAERLSRNARVKAVRYDWEVILPQWESVLMHVANGASS